MKKRKPLKKTPPPSLRLGPKRLPKWKQMRREKEAKYFIKGLAEKIATVALEAVEKRIDEVAGAQFKHVDNYYPPNDAWGVMELETGGMLFGKYINGDFYEYIHGYLVRWNGPRLFRQFMVVEHPRGWVHDCDIVREVKVTAVPPVGYLP